MSQPAQTPQLITTAAQMASLSRSYQRQGQRLGFVATMGYLHRGHLSLVEIAKSHADRVVVSIYVNPTQFGADEDLDTYPRDFQTDLDALSALGVDAVFAPSDAEMYPTGFATTVHVRGLTAGLCGKSRPSHFDGVTTVVTKLFQLVQPDLAVFGEKDYQQLVVIRRMVTDLDMPVQVLGGPIAREADGLAMSSRNANLSAEQRRAAPAIQLALREMQRQFRAGVRSAAQLLAEVSNTIESQACLRIDYVELVNPDDLGGLSGTLPERVHVAAAVFAGNTRLIDNLRLSENDA